MLNTIAIKNLRPNAPAWEACTTMSPTLIGLLIVAVASRIGVAPNNAAALAKPGRLSRTDFVPRPALAVTLINAEALISKPPLSGTWVVPPPPLPRKRNVSPTDFDLGGLDLNICRSLPGTVSSDLAHCFVGRCHILTPGIEVEADRSRHPNRAPWSSTHISGVDEHYDYRGGSDQAGSDDISPGHGTALFRTRSVEVCVSFPKTLSHLKTKDINAS